MLENAEESCIPWSPSIIETVHRETWQMFQYFSEDFQADIMVKCNMNFAKLNIEFLSMKRLGRYIWKLDQTFSPELVLLCSL